MTIHRLQLAHITKRYPAVVANSDVSLTVAPGETHAVLGENGAGKSTLMKIIYGSVKPDEGSVMFNGQPVNVRNPQEARALGISMVFQHFSLFDTLTVAENVWLGLDKSLALAEVARRVQAKAGEYGLDIDPSRPVHTLSVGEMQRVEIIRALLTDPKLLILDEPTSVLTPQAVQKLFVVLKKLASEGCSILYISHKLHEIRELCTACTVLRGGKVTGVCNPQNESNESLSRLMIGAEPPPLTHRPIHAGAVALKVKGLTLAREDQFGVDLDGISLDVRAGEVVGIAGVSGNGQKELLYVLSGEDTRAEARMIEVFGQAAAHYRPRRRRALGLHFVPEERLGRGAVPTLGLAHNLLLTRSNAVGKGGWIRTRALNQHASDIIKRFNVKAGGPGGGGALAVGRQSAEIHRRPGDRRQPEDLHRLAADLGRRRRGGGADPRRDPRAARRRLRGARGERGTRRALRNQRPPVRDRQGAAVAVDRPLRRHGAADRRVDEWSLGQVASRRNGVAGGGPCLSSNPARSCRASGATPRRSWRC